jgi:hypothetical protein
MTNVQVPTPVPEATRQRIQGLSPAQRDLLLRRLAEKQSAATAAQPFSAALSPWITVQRRPLLDLIAAGELPRADAVSITCVTQRRLADGRPVREVLGRGRGDLPLVSRMMHTPLGRIATVLLPRTYGEIYLPETKTGALAAQAMQVAATIGARVVSLTGLIPSATDYGRSIPHRPGLPEVTTGHATTTSAVVLSIKQVLDRAGRNLADEHVCFVGVGSVGRATLGLMLRALPHPRRLSLCDLFSRRDDFAALMRELREQFGFAGTLDFIPSHRQVGAEAYAATLIVGATNAPNVLDVAQLRPGTLIVDDSDPHCFDAEAAKRRLAEAGDVMFSEGGFLRLTEVIGQDLFAPEEAAELVAFRAREEAARNITGCNLSSLLSLRFGLPRTIGPVAIEDARLHLAGLVRLGIAAAHLHISDLHLREEQIEAFRQRHGAGGDPANAFTSWVASATLPPAVAQAPQTSR